MELIKKLILKILGGNKLEQRLLRCQNYQPDSVIPWKNQTNLNYFQIIKFLKAIEIFDSIRIRNIIKDIFENNSNIFSQPDLFITSFGSEGKSGGKIIYEFRHSNLINNTKFINAWELSQLPENSTVIFVDDLIGTGSQSSKYILNKLNLLLNPSTKAYLLTICATPEGIETLSTKTNFEVITGLTLDEKNYQYYTDACKYFSRLEKLKLICLNKRLKNNDDDFDRGLLVTFYYSPPNNSMPILWKHNYPYTNAKGERKNWLALLPRKY